ncbi:MAG TPA: acetyl-CoA C-acetyltransferase [Candidatus Marinimicrobia bacterium]|nr:acetyl-CoA C-acetyltransferase [Candidatus Neomarinimicrobiota bacterium]
MKQLRDVLIIDAVRTPIGSFQGALAAVPAPKLGALMVKSLIERNKLNPEAVDEVIMGNVIATGEGQSPARQAALFGGLPQSVQTMTINKVCGSGLKSVMLAAQAIQVGDANIIIAGGMESMSNVPYILPKARDGYRLGHSQVLDGIIVDGLWDVYSQVHMGSCAEGVAKDEKLTREEMDEFAKMSYERAQAATANGAFKDEIIPVLIPQKKGDPILVEIDEEPTRANFAKMASLRPAFEKDGVITAANASKINDGASATLIMSAEKAEELGYRPMAKVIAQASAAHAPEKFASAPLLAIEKVLKKAGLTADEIDLWEINEAFAHVAFLPMRKFNIPKEKVNINGGAIAMGHPIGASGARVLTTLLHAMNKQECRYGLASLCIGGGEAVALIVEKL